MTDSIDCTTNPCGLQRKFRNDGSHCLEIGVDEVGRGCLFGPVCTAAVAIPDDMPFLLNPRNVIKDSKKLSKLQRERLYKFILGHATYVEVTMTTNQEIDESNILRATMKSMHQSITKVLHTHHIKTGKSISAVSTQLLIDGTYFEPFLFDKTIMIPHVCVPQGDAHYLAIACASIIAKVTRDRWIKSIVEVNPTWKEKYGFHTNMGYGTKAHMDGIKEHGVTEYHRMSFAPCGNRRVVTCLIEDSDDE